MISFMMGWWRARAARPLLWCVVTLLVYAIFPVPPEWVLLLIVGLGVALTVTVRQLREGDQVVAQPYHAGCVQQPPYQHGGW